MKTAIFTNENTLALLQSLPKYPRFNVEQFSSNEKQWIGVASKILGLERRLTYPQFKKALREETGVRYRFRKRSLISTIILDFLLFDDVVEYVQGKYLRMTKNYKLYHETF